ADFRLKVKRSPRSILALVVAILHGLATTRPFTVMLISAPCDVLTLMDSNPTSSAPANRYFIKTSGYWNSRVKVAVA
ncbi:hypothetical protein ELD60_32295, partial [Klebsiella pneumoniae]|nr:hypothetical protein [Klebsiella pneumoniae]